MNVILFNVFVAAWAMCGLVWVHEYGHYVAGLIAGIPKNRLKVKLLPLPPHVALLDSKDWAHPLHDRSRYVSICTDLIKHRGRLIGYIVGGLIAQTIGYLVIILTLSIMHAPAVVAVTFSAVLTSGPLIYLLGDILSTYRKRQPYGDFSVMWSISPAASFAITVAVMSVHFATLVILIKNAG